MSTKSNRVYDPKGNELRPVLLQIISSDPRGPVMLRMRYDDEEIGLAEMPEEERRFLMVWSAAGIGIGEVGLIELAADLDSQAAKITALEAKRAQLDRDLEAARRTVDDLEADNRTKTEELRRLQRERDPERVQAAIGEAVDRALAAQAAEVATLKADREKRDSEIRELKEAKRRLKEANERLREGRR